MIIVSLTVSMVESTDVYLALSDITNDPIDNARACATRYRAEGLAVLLGGIFNTFPTGFSQNAGLVKLSGIKTACQSTTQLVPSPPWTPSKFGASPKPFQALSWRGHAGDVWFCFLQGMQNPSAR